jgi:hypothetical protein
MGKKKKRKKEAQISRSYLSGGGGLWLLGFVLRGWRLHVGLS